MQDYILKGVVLKAIDWKEKDKLVTIFTLEKGIVTASFRGVRQQKSKLKFATQPLCFAEFSLTGSGDILTCIGASEIESFFAVTQDYDDMVLAGAVLEMVYHVAIKEPNVDLFISLIRALGGLCDDNTQHEVVFLKFCLQLFKTTGYGINFDTCKTCGKSLNGVNLDLECGALVCDECKTLNCIAVSSSSAKILQLIDNLPFTQLQKIKLSQTQFVECRKLFVCNFNSLFEKKLKSIPID